MPPRFDLQAHSTHSDGALAAAEVVQRAADAGVELLALSDHDTTSGVSEALTAGERLGVRVVPAVEISAVDDGAPAPRELHILGYNIDHTGPPMTSRLEEFLADREKRTLRMAAALGSAASSSTAARSTSASPPRSRSAARISPPRCSARPPTQSACAKRRSTTSAR